MKIRIYQDGDTWRAELTRRRWFVGRRERAIVTRSKDSSQYQKCNNYEGIWWTLLDDGPDPFGEVGMLLHNRLERALNNHRFPKVKREKPKKLSPWIPVEDLPKAKAKYVLDS